MRWLGLAAFLLSGCYGAAGESGAGGPRGGAGGDNPGDTAGTGNATNGVGGTAGTSGAGGTATDVCSHAAPPPAARVRRLTKLELESALRGLVGDLANGALDTVEADSQIDGRYSNDARLVASASFLSGLKLAADLISADFKTTVRPDAYDSACFDSDSAAESCAETFIRSFGERAYRRVLDAGDVAELMGVYLAGRDAGVDGDAGDRFATGLSWIVKAVVQAPDFLYVTELGDPNLPEGSVVQLLPREIASVLSFSVVGTPPDEPLVEAAEAGLLGSSGERVEQALRLVATHPDSWKRQMRAFVSQWLGINFNTPEWTKTPDAAPGFSDAIREALQTETNLLIDDWAVGPNGTHLHRLLTEPSTFVSPINAPVYGVSTSSAGFERVKLDATRRAGILTLGGFLGSTSHTSATSPVLRGKAILQRVLCRDVPPPPPDVPALPLPNRDTGGTTRARYELHLSDKSCSGCHALFDPMGFAFEAYDVLGAYRTEENGAAVDSSGALVEADGTLVPVSSAVELVHLLAESREVRACAARQIFRFTLGREEEQGDACLLQEVTRVLSDGSGALVDVVSALVASDRFVMRQVYP